jgi:CRP/FNR family nitrogen fixation transcriptional regulator
MKHAAPQPRADDAPPAIGVVRYFTPDQTIYVEGDPAAHLILVIDGLVRSCSAFPDGRRFIGAFHGAGDIFGIESKSTYHDSAEAVRETTLVFYPTRDLAEMSGAKDKLARQVLGSMLRSLDQERGHARLLGRLSAIERLSAFLLEGFEPTNERRLLTLEMTRQDMADYLGLTVETISRSLAQLKRDQVIAFISARKLKLLNIPALRALSL